MIHPLARRHLHKKGSLLSGMPNEGGQNNSLRPLHLNLNFFSNSDYVYYPADRNERLSWQFIEYLKSESTENLSFLNPDYLLFISVSESIDLLIRTFCDPEDTVCFASPTFPLYEYCAQNHNCVSIGVPLYGSDLEHVQVLDILKKHPKLTFLATPNNPTGVFLNVADVSNLIEAEQGILAIDEAYIEFSDHSSFVGYVRRFENLVILRSFSKIWGLAGIRMGVTIAHPTLIRTLRALMTPCNFPIHTQKILETVLLNIQEIPRMKDLVQQEKKRIVQRISQLSFVKRIYPSEANFLLIEFSDADAIYETLFQNGFQVRNCSQAIANTLRISLGTVKDNEKWVALLEDLNFGSTYHTRLTIKA